MVKVSDCGCCDCDSKQEYETVKERALSSVNKVYTTEGATFYPDGTGMVTLPIPTNAQIAQWAQDTETIKTNSADIVDLETRVEGVEETTGKIPTTYNLYRDGTGKIRLQASATDGSLIDSNTLDMIIPYQYDLISGTTSRSFRLQITMSDGAQYLTNDFVIPEGGGTDVTVTGIVLSKDTSDVNRIHVQINLSDSTMIDSGYISMVDSVGGSVTDGALTITVNGVSGVPIDLGTAKLESDITNVLTVANRAFDAVSIADNVLTLERGNGGTESVTLPSGGGGDEWEEVDLKNWPTDWVVGTRIKIEFKNFFISNSAGSDSWTVAPTNAPTINASNGSSPIIEFALPSNENSKILEYALISIPEIPLITGYPSTVTLALLSMYSVTNLNLKVIGTLTLFRFNGGGTKLTNINLSETLTTYVKSIKRILPS